MAPLSRSSFLTCSAFSSFSLAIGAVVRKEANSSLANYRAPAEINWQAAWPPMAGANWSAPQYVPQAVREFASDALLEPALQTHAIDTTMLVQACWHGTIWFAALSIANLAFVWHTKRNPDGPLAKRVSDGSAFEAFVHEYYVSMFGEGVILPVLWGISFFTHSGTFKEWWYGAQSQWATTEFSAYFIGYFLQDLLVHAGTTGVLLAVHHIFSVSASIAACLATGWRGSFMTVALAFELGSFHLNLSDLGCLPRRLGHLILIVSSIVPMIWLCIGIGFYPPSDGFVIYGISVGLVAGLIRCLESFRGIKKLSLIEEDEMLDVRLDEGGMTEGHQQPAAADEQVP